MSLPFVVDKTTMGATTGTATVPWPVHAAGDIALLFIQSANQAVSLASAQGFALVGTIGTGTAGAAGSVLIAVYWCRATSGSMPSPQVAAVSDHLLTRMVTIRGCIDTGNPVDLSATSTAASATAVSCPTITTTGVDELIIAAVANAIDTSTDGQISGWTNGALTGLAELFDSNSSMGQGGGMAVATGGKATAGATGATTATLLAASNQARIQLALKSAATGVAMMPTFQAAGIPVGATGAGVTVAWPAHLEGDVALLVVTSSNEAISLTTPAGFVEVTGSPQSTGTAGGPQATRLAVYWCRATSSGMASPVVANPGDHVHAQILTFRGCVASGNPWDITATGTDATTTQTLVSVPGGTTTVANTLVVAIAGDSRDTSSLQYSAWTNPDLTGLVEIADSHGAEGNGSGHGAACGGKAVAGAFAVTTATMAGSGSPFAYLTLALKGVVGAGGGGGGGGPTDPAVPHRYWRMKLVNTPGAGPEVNEVELVERVGTVAAQDSIITQPAQLHPGVTHIRPFFHANQGSDGAAQFDLDMMLMTIPAGYSPDIPTDQVTRKVDTFYWSDGILVPGVGLNDGAGALPLVRGVVRGTAQHGDQVVFSDFGRVFQTVPAVTLSGGILYQPASKWGTAAAVDAGTASSAPSATTPQYEDFAALDPDEGGFTVQARLRQKATITPRSLSFAGTHLDTPNEADTISTLTNAPANDNRYIVTILGHFSVRSDSLSIYRVNLNWVIETTTNSGASWQARASGTIVGQSLNNPGPFFEISQQIIPVVCSVSGLTSDGTDRVRVRLLSITTTGLGSYDLPQTFVLAQVLTFNTSSDTYASKTPASDDLVYWEAVGYV